MHLLPTLTSTTGKSNHSSALPKEGHFAPQEAQYLRDHLLTWYRQHRRHLPWRGDPPPYTGVEEVLAATATAIASTAVTTLPTVPTTLPTVPTTPYSSWVCEIMSQQTRVETVVKYHTVWMARFPTVQSLAIATEEEVNKYWAGLGYYRRARFLHQGSKYVMEHHEGQLPQTIAELKKIPGIGPYTAGAIASIAFGVYAPLVDGNVVRVLSRLRAFGGNPKHAPLIEGCWEVATRLVEGGRVVDAGLQGDRAAKEDNDSPVLFHPGDFNQSLMELGATICSPKLPKCPLCPVREVCRAFAEVHTTTEAAAAASSSSSSSSSFSSSSSSVATTTSATRSNNRGRASIVIDYAEDEEERVLYSRVRATCVTKYPYPKKKKKLKEENWNVTVVEWQPKTVRNGVHVGTAVLLILLLL